ncbi:hypothetical protein ACF0H5_010408 [Mactra antiquata]
MKTYEEFAQTLNNRSNTMLSEIPSALQSTGFERNSDLEECISTFMITNSFRHSEVAQRDAYIMISRCPKKYDREDIPLKELKVLEQCEKDVDFRYWPLEVVPAETLIPVTSYQTGKTYKNLNCLKCNEGMRKGIYWTSWFTCRNPDSIQIVFSDPIEMFLMIAKFTYCNIVFKPPNPNGKVDGRDLKKCNYADIRTCSKAWIHANNDSQQVKSYESACRQFYNPVNRNENNIIVYNNVVCERCNTIRSSKCIHIDGRNYDSKIEINFNVISQTSKISLNSENVTLDIQNIDNSSCSKGYIYDPVDNICRLIYCPQMYYNQRGICVPNAQRLENFLYSFTLTLFPQPFEFLRENGKRIEIFEKGLTRFLVNALDEKITSFSLKVWRYYTNNVLNTYIIDIQFDHKNETYPNILRMIQEFMSTMSTFQTSVLNRKISASVFFLQNEALSIRGHTRSVVVKSVNMKIKRTEQIFSYHTNKLPPVFSFQITRSHLCMRIELRAKDLRIIGRQFAKIVRTNVTIQGHDFNPTINGDGFYACIKDFLGIDLKFRPRMFSSDDRSGNKDKQNIVSTVFLILGPLGIGLFVIIIWVCYKVFVKKRL